ncbi:hypothetical protein BJY24_001047 [Nocardia transvalensis]|uniref:DUF2399 domain-containing protein n=1 Tax=Nocardia transvalensis TaxID=37333 RepID=A0A7W9UGZ6_9NOCA|nr:DUF2399 domain-containing protein [Nocardia transvalensis]MBB5912180.1 hypothetical protein [Nocardia transvalensis]
MTVEGVAVEDLRWAIKAQRRYWASIEQRFGHDAREHAVRLAVAGVVDLICTVDEFAHITDILRWQRTSIWDEHQRRNDICQSDDAQLWQTRAQDAARQIAATDPGLAKALIATGPNNPRLPVLVYAAEDLVDGVTHDGPRAFSQTHFRETKTREDSPKVLAEAGAAPETLIALGLRRSPYIGLGGPITIHTAAGNIDLAAVDGPVQFRVDQRSTFDVRLGPSTRLLVIVENLQAAEAVCDTAPDVATVWSAGQPSKHALRLIRRLSTGVAATAIATDADLGGVRIARRILGALASTDDVTVLDAGIAEHPKRKAFGQASRDGLHDATNSADPIADFARACLARGYPVEQEATIRSTLATFIASQE